MDKHQDAAEPVQSQQGLPDAAQRDSQVGVVFGAFLTHAFKILISILWHTGGQKGWKLQIKRCVYFPHQLGFHMLSLLFN